MFVIKDKNPPNKKNGANGINFCLFMFAQIAPVIHAITNAVAMPVIPNQMPPTPINFMSPMPIGDSEFGFFLRKIMSNINPIKTDIVYPNIAPITASVIGIGNA